MQPRISVVTPCFNQAVPIRTTIESVLDQDHSDVEHIVVDRGSTDGTLELLRQYPHLTLASTPGRGDIDAFNRGLELADGQTLSALESGDVLLPGALSRAVGALDPRRGRHVVVGRSRLATADGRFTGIQYPGCLEGRRSVLAVWTHHVLPAPALFWTREAWASCGPLDHHLDPELARYDLLCRLSSKYQVHVLDDAGAASRLDPEDPRTEAWGGADRLEDRIRVSRRHWGRPLSPAYWRLAVSLALFRFDRLRRAREHLRQTRERWQRGHAFHAIRHAFAGMILSPRVGFRVGIYPFVRDRVGQRLVERLEQRRVLPAQSAAYAGHTEPWSDGWVGPWLVATRTIDSPARFVSLRGSAKVGALGRPLVLTLRVDDRPIGRRWIVRPGGFVARIPLVDPVVPGSHTVEIEANRWFVPGRSDRSGDFRPLAWRLIQLDFEW